MAASQDLLYELERFFGCWYLLSDRWPDFERLGTSCEEAVGVAFLVHSRSVVSVFLPTSSHLEDVIAADFYAQPDDWAPALYADQDEVRAIRRWVNRDVAHVSYRRLVRGNDRRDYALTHRVVSTAALAFIETVPEHVVSPYFCSAVRAAAESPSAGAD